MNGWSILLLSTLAFVSLVAGLLVLAVPDSLEGQTLYAIDNQHSVRVLDGVGLALLSVGMLMAWGGGVMWQRRQLP